MPGPRHGRSDQWRNHGSIPDALEQAVHDRRPAKGMGLVHHSDRGSQYLPIKYTERLAEAGIQPSVGSVGDSYEFKLVRASGSDAKNTSIGRRWPRGLSKLASFRTPSSMVSSRPGGIR